MRLTEAERHAVQAACKEHWPDGSRVSLFGSRTDDSARGGDVDLLVEIPHPLSPAEVVNRRSRFVARLQSLTEERRIDVVVTELGSADDRPVVRQARQQAQALS
ncbi:MAG: nucleotidyltransferase domain-containing protein [Rubrivivax sp.]|jgi:predicted nucleotidyltransferase